MGYFVTVELGVKVFIEDINPKGNKTILFIHGWPLNHNQF
ncbi:alpha/beta hydrolase, partial [Paenibacillus sp. SYP-B3998]|nr:alpha/beta hydrolase [Paenibacillus sp. SYP-B3998]